MSIEDYLERCQVVGSLISPDSAYAFDIRKDNAIVSIRGCPRLSLIQELGKNLNIQPEHLLNHLTSPDCFQIRPLKSRQHLSVVVRMVTLGQYDVDGDTSPSAKLEQIRVDRRTEEHNRSLLQKGSPGTEQCRKVNIHGLDYFSWNSKSPSSPTTWRSIPGQASC